METTYKLILIAATTALMTGCRSVDLASQHTGPAPKCEIHGMQMEPAWIPVSSGEVVYEISYGYLDYLKQRFPHHGGFLLNGEREFHQPFDRRVRDFVCPDCTLEFEAYWKQKWPDRK